MALSQKSTPASYHGFVQKTTVFRPRKEKFAALDFLGDFQARGAGVFGTA
jgi:hypothetical protein